MSADRFFENIKRRMLDQAFEALAEKARGAASAIVDPETGKHATVFVRRKGDASVVIRTRGSPAFARELEKRLGIEKGAIETMQTLPNTDVPHVYLAHASEDHECLARPLAERLMEAGIDVWLDDWEIKAGDSLRRKMEEGLAGCTHFLVLLTPVSLEKKWVQTEIDAGFVRSVEGEARFIGLRAGVAVSELSPFLKTLRCPELALDNAEEIQPLIGDIYGVSRKPPRGEAPRYVKSAPEGLKTWSSAAIAVAEYLVRNSKTGQVLDPHVDVSQMVEGTGLSHEDARIGVLDLKDAALIEESKTMDSDSFWPRPGLFVEFDRHFMDFDNERDAIAVANWLVSTGERQFKIQALTAQFPEWAPRRLNSALHFLDEAKIIQAEKTLGQAPWAMSGLSVTDRTRRFVRDNG